MKIESSIENSGNQEYLVIIADCEWSEESAKQVIDMAAHEAEKGKHQKILFDLTKWSKPETELVRYHAGEYLARKMKKTIKIAAFAAGRDINKFGETVAVNRGAWFRIFPTKEEAVLWLTG